MVGAEVADITNEYEDDEEEEDDDADVGRWLLGLLLMLQLSRVVSRLLMSCVLRLLDLFVVFRCGARPDRISRWTWAGRPDAEP